MISQRTKRPYNSLSTTACLGLALFLLLSRSISPSEKSLFCLGLSIPSIVPRSSRFANTRVCGSRSSSSSSSLSLTTTTIHNLNNNHKARNKESSSTALFYASDKNSTTAAALDPQQQPLKPLKPPLSKNQEALSRRRFPRTWVPLASVFELDPNRPTPLEFLDQKFVCYQQNENKNNKNNENKHNIGDDDVWIVMDDACPHRLVPLSEGRISRATTTTSKSECSEQHSATTAAAAVTPTTSTSMTTIQCSYHGWEFDGSNHGACVTIPQANAELESLSKASPRAFVTTYSTMVHKSVLWFWPWADTDPLSLLPVYPKGHPEGIMASIANLAPGDLDDENDNNNSNSDSDENVVVVNNPSTYTRDLPYGWDTLLENLIDPAHIPFAHHGLQGTREDAIPIQMTVPESLGEFKEANSGDSNSNSNSKTPRSGEAGFLFEWQDRTMGKHRAGTAEFQAPFGIAYEGKFYDTKEEADVLWGTHSEKKRHSWNGKAKQNETSKPTSEAASDDASDETLAVEPKEHRPFALGVLCIPTKPGWSRAIILGGGRAKKIQAKAKKLAQSPSGKASSSSSATSAVVEATPKVTSKPTAKKKKTKKKKRKKSLVAIVFGIIPTWAMHLISNKFLDSDLAFLHYQEQERLRYEASSNSGSGSSSFYFMPAPSDRCIAKLRQWIPKHTDYLGGSNDNKNGNRDGEGHSYSLPPPIVDRSKLFDRYLQHTSQCKHCQKGLTFLRTKARKFAWGGLVASVVASHFLGRRLLGLAAKLLAVACLGSLRLLASLEKAFLVGDFKHYQND